MRPNWKWGIGVVAVVMLGLVALLLMRSPGPSASPSQVSLSATDSATRPVTNKEQVTSAPDRVGSNLTAETIEQIAQRVQPLGLHHGSALRDAVADTLTVYASGTVDDWLGYLSSYGIAPPAVASSRPAVLRRRWEQSRTFFNETRFDIHNMKIERNPRSPRIENAEDAVMATGLPGDYLIKARRDGGRGFLANRAAERVRVTIPSTFRSMDPRDGSFNPTPIEGNMSFEFTYNPDDGQWVLTEIRIEGNSDEDRSPSVPLLL